MLVVKMLSLNFWRSNCVRGVYGYILYVYPVFSAGERGGKPRAANMGHRL